MPNLQRFCIELNENKSIYRPGESISGKLLIKNNERFRIKKLVIELRGQAKYEYGFVKNKFVYL